MPCTVIVVGLESRNHSVLKGIIFLCFVGTACSLQKENGIFQVAYGVHIIVHIDDGDPETLRTTGWSDILDFISSLKL